MGVPPALGQAYTASAPLRRSTTPPRGRPQGHRRTNPQPPLHPEVHAARVRKDVFARRAARRVYAYLDSEAWDTARETDHERVRVRVRVDDREFAISALEPELGAERLEPFAREHLVAPSNVASHRRRRPGGARGWGSQAADEGRGRGVVASRGGPSRG